MLEIVETFYIGYFQTVNTILKQVGILISQLEMYIQYKVSVL